MITLPIHDMSGAEVGTYDLDPAVTVVEPEGP